MCSIHTMEYYSAAKRHEVLIHATRRMNLRITFLSERGQRQRDKCCLIPLPWDTQKIHGDGNTDWWLFMGWCWVNWGILLNGCRVDSGWWKCFGTRQMRWFPNIVNVLNVTDLLTLKWFILCCANFTSIKIKILIQVIVEKYFS